MLFVIRNRDYYLVVQDLGRWVLPDMKNVGFNKKKGKKNLSSKLRMDEF